MLSWASAAYSPTDIESARSRIADERPWRSAGWFVRMGRPR